MPPIPARGRARGQQLPALLTPQLPPKGRRASQEVGVAQAGAAGGWWRRAGSQEHLVGTCPPSSTSPRSPRCAIMGCPERDRIRSLRNPSWASASQEKILLLYSAFLSPSGRFAGHAKFVPESPEGPVRDLITALESSPRLCLTDWSCSCQGEEGRKAGQSSALFSAATTHEKKPFETSGGGKKEVRQY